MVSRDGKWEMENEKEKKFFFTYEKRKTITLQWQHSVTSEMKINRTVS